MVFERRYDVVVVGGGIAGVAAALAAARCGKRTVLIEKTVMLGGLATTGLIYYYLPLCDGAGRQVSFGLAEELLKLSLVYSPDDPPPFWSGDRSADPLKRYASLFSPAGFVLSLGERLEAEGVDLMLDTLACDVRMDGDRIRAVEVETMVGRGLVTGDAFVDASGDATLIRRAGGDFAWGPNRLSLWALECRRLAPRGTFDSLHCKQFNEKDELPVVFDEGTATRFVMYGWHRLQDYYRERYASGEASRHDLFPVHLPAMPQFRKIARIIGRATLADDQENTRFGDSIGLIADWCKPGPVWEVPYDILVPERIKGVLAAGRIVSSVGYAWDMTRVIPAAALTGEAAGVAVAMALDKGCLPDRLPVGELQDELRTRDFRIHLDEVGL